MSKLLILSNHYNSLRIFRRELLIELSKHHKVIVSMPSCDEENRKIIESYGCEIVTTEFERRGMNPVKDIALLRKYKRLLKEIQPDMVVAYTIKPNIYGAMACKSANIPCCVNVTGLGSAFQSQGGIMRKLVSFLYKISLNKVKCVFFENAGSRDTLVNDGIIKKEQTVVLPGAGVNLQEFSPVPFPKDNNTKFLFVGRIMKEKGVDELFYAIEKITEQYPETSFEFIGWYEDDYKDQVNIMQKAGLISFYGFQPDVKPFIESCQCVILPSYHEGMSNTLLEGAAMSRALIASNINGCKEALVDKKTGFLVNVQDKESLCKAIKRFIELPTEEKEEMGRQGRIHIEKNFDKNMVVEKTIKEMGV